MKKNVREWVLSFVGPPQKMHLVKSKEDLWIVGRVMIVSPTISTPSIFASSSSTSLAPAGSACRPRVSSSAVGYIPSDEDDGIALLPFCWLFRRPNPDTRFSLCQKPSVPQPMRATCENCELPDFLAPFFPFVRVHSNSLYIPYILYFYI